MIFAKPTSCLPRAIVAVVAISFAPASWGATDAAGIIKAAIDYWRDVSSDSVSEMIIHRPDWQRAMTIRVWTKGQKQSLVRVIAPPKDIGNATLLLDNDMWSFNPKINRVIRIPSSMMNQSWMGSDFSNNDLAKADDLIEQYNHKLLHTEKKDGHTVYVIEAKPKEAAPVVWGREVITVRDDYVLLAHAFFDQTGVLIKQLVTDEIAPLGGKLIVTRERMERLDRPGEWTEIVVREARFGIRLPDGFFTLSNLRNPRA